MCWMNTFPHANTLVQTMPIFGDLYSMLFNCVLLCSLCCVLLLVCRFHPALTHSQQLLTQLRSTGGGSHQHRCAACPQVVLRLLVRPSQQAHRQFQILSLVRTDFCARFGQAPPRGSAPSAPPYIKPNFGGLLCTSAFWHLFAQLCKRSTPPPQCPPTTPWSKSIFLT